MRGTVRARLLVALLLGSILGCGGTPPPTEKPGAGHFERFQQKEKDKKGGGKAGGLRP